MIVYLYDAEGVYIQADETELDHLETKLQGKEIYLLPPNATFTKPEVFEGFIPVWKDGSWLQVEDHRGTSYWLPGDSYETPARIFDVLGPLPADALFTPPEPTKEELEAKIQAELTNVVQTALDDFAKTRNYDGILSVCSYANSANPKFKAEADYCIKLRDDTWAAGYGIVDQVKSGIRDIPTPEEVIALLPVGSAKWPDEA